MIVSPALKATFCMEPPQALRARPRRSYQVLARLTAQRTAQVSAAGGPVGPTIPDTLGRQQTKYLLFAPTEVPTPDLRSTFARHPGFGFLVRFPSPAVIASSNRQNCPKS
jgi:hypothetical protein